MMSCASAFSLHLFGKNKSQPVNIICLSIEVFHEVNSYKEANAVMELGFLLGF